MQFDPLVYWKLKSAMLELALNESQLQSQLTALQQRRTKLMADHGLPPSMYVMNDAQCSVELAPELTGAAPAAAPEAAPTPPVVPVEEPDAPQ